jgi:predicted transcriptional regulator
MSKYGTKFAETELLLAVMSGDRATMARIIGDMTPHEQREMARVCDRIKSELWYTLNTAAQKESTDGK